MHSLADKFTGRQMQRSFNQLEAFNNHIIPREMTAKAMDILADDRNYLTSIENQKIKHTFVNSSKNLRQLMNDDKYSVNANRCKIFMDSKQGLRDNIIKQNVFKEIVYQCCSLHVVTRTVLMITGKYLIIYS